MIDIKRSHRVSICKIFTCHYIKKISTKKIVYMQKLNLHKNQSQVMSQVEIFSVIQTFYKVLINSNPQLLFDNLEIKKDIKNV